MNPNTSKLRQKQETTEQIASQQTAREFASPEEMLRHDAGQISPPPGLAHRVAESIAKEPRPARSWWQRWFSRRSTNP
ncbi:MAG TPA: hypothetical protein VEL06_08490 [Haliangiales bacterium]|nr:hypothetical protein [Haliangiales bacterium]